MNRFLKFAAGALLALTFLLAPMAPAAAQYQPTNGMPTIDVPHYNVTVSIWSAETYIGALAGIFEKNSAGLWYKFGGPDPATDLYDRIMAAGGYHPYVVNVLLPIFKASLAQRYPAVGGGPVLTGNSTLDDLNAEMFYSLQFKVNADGTVTLYPK